MQTWTKTIHLLDQRLSMKTFLLLDMRNLPKVCEAYFKSLNKITKPSRNCQNSPAPLHKSAIFGKTCFFLNKKEIYLALTHKNPPYGICCFKKNGVGPITNRPFINKPAAQAAGQTLPDATPPVGNIHPFSKIALTFGPIKQFRCPSRFRISEKTSI